MNSTQSIQRLEEEIHGMLLDPSIDTRVKLWARDRRTAIAGDLSAVRRANAYRDFVLSYIQREAAKYKAFLHDEPEAHPYDGRRERQLCSCDEEECPIKQEELPRQLREADSLDAGFIEFRHDHRGHPLLLDEARQAFTKRVQHVEQALTNVMVGLANEVVIDEDGRRVPVGELPAGWTPTDGVDIGEVAG